jgi:hypothetical protein
MWETLGTQQATNIVSLVLVLVTGIYVFLTYRIASANSSVAIQMLNQQENISRPVISANIQVRSQVLFLLVIRNSGAGVATKVTLTLDRDFFRFGERKREKNLRELDVFNGAEFTLAPGDSLQFDLAQGFVVFAEGADEALTPTRFKIYAKYNSQVKRYEETIEVDLKPYRMTVWPKSELALEIEKLTKVVKA